MKIGTVVEGPTDRLLLKAIIDHVYPGEHTYRDLQPADSGETFGGRGTGWKGARRFCFDVWQQLNDSIYDFIVDHNYDLLVIHIDADIASETDLQEGVGNPVLDVAQPCPSILPTIEKLREVIKKWLNLDNSQLPSQIIFAIPAQDSEHWVFAALFPNDELCQKMDYECFNRNTHQRPVYKLSLSEYGRVLHRKDGKIKKSTPGYRAILPDVIRGWDDACKICTQAQAFTNDLANVSRHE